MPNYPGDPSAGLSPPGSGVGNLTWQAGAGDPKEPRCECYTMWSGFPGLRGNSSGRARPEDGSSWRVTKGFVSSGGRFPTQLLRGDLSLSVSSKGPFLLMWSGYQIQNFLCPWLSCLVSFTGMRCDRLSFKYHKNKNGFQTLKKEKIGSGWIPHSQLTFKNKQRRLKGRKQWD